MSNVFLDSIFREMISKLIGAGLSDTLAQVFAEECCGYRKLHRAHFELSEALQLPSDDCFRTLAEAQKIFVAKEKSEYSQELHNIENFLMMPYSEVVAAKKAMSENFGCNKSDVEALYAESSEWLLITPDSVRDFAAFLSTKFADLELCWDIYKEAALLGLEKTERRINAVLKLLGPEHGEAAIREDAHGYGWLYYRWYTDPVGCIEYMLQCGLTPDKIPNILKQEQVLLYAYKEIHTWSYNHDQEYIDKTIQKYLN